MDTDSRVPGRGIDVRSPGRRLHTRGYGREICLSHHHPGTYIPQISRTAGPPPPNKITLKYNPPQFFFNFGPNDTTFIVPPEVFPSRVRGFAHGLSAAAGKLGAILSALLFNYLSAPSKLGLANVLWIFFGCNVLGAAITWAAVPETRMRDADADDYEEWFERVVDTRR